MFIIENGLVLYGENMEALKANVIVENGKISEITKEKRTNVKKIDATGCIVAPSLINSHTHIGDSLARDVGDGESIERIVKPPNGLKHRILRESESEEIIDSMKQSMMEMLASGTTTFVDFREGGFKGLDLIEEASEDISIRKIVLGRHKSFFDPDAEISYVKNVTKNLLKFCDGIAASGFGEIREDIVGMITEICRKQKKISAIHVAEYEKLQEQSLKKTGKTEVERAINSGFDLLIHLTSPIRDDLELIAQSGNSVVCCPRSNGLLAVGIPPIKEIFDRGINILLGTDNVLFNSPNMLREMDYALKVVRGYYKDYFAPAEIFKMATINPAKAFNLDLGCIKEGKTADVMLVKQISNNPILSIINRTESKNIVGLIKDGDILFKKT